jgi:PfaD family protein
MRGAAIIHENASCWQADPASGEALVWLAPEEALRRLARHAYAVRCPDGVRFTTSGRALLGAGSGPEGALPLAGVAPPVDPARLGDASFCEDHGLALPLYAGSMAHGISSETLVAAMGRAGMLGFYGAAGESPGKVEEALARLQETLAGVPFGFNLINSPNDPAWEMAVAEVYLRRGLRLIEASAYIAPTPALVKYRVSGIYRAPDGAVVAPNRVIAKVSRVEIAARFFAPPAEKILRGLVESGGISAEEALLAAEVPLAQDLTGEADSGGHTDHRAALAMLPSLLQLRDGAAARHGYSVPLRVGLAGGIATPHAVAAAFAMGAAWVVTGSVNQACVESGSSDAVRALLAAAAQTDVARVPSADMFEMGVTVQVLKKGVRFAERAARLMELYRLYESIDAIPDEDRRKLEETVFRMPLDGVWENTRRFFESRDPRQLEKAAASPRHKMALVFRWYLGQSPHWANHGVPERVDDYQIWCGPGMGAFNDWVRGSFMEAPENRRAPLVARNLLFHAAVLLRAAPLRAQGVALAPSDLRCAPLRDEELSRYCTVEHGKTDS